MPNENLHERKVGRTYLYVRYAERSSLMEGRAHADTTHDARYVVRSSGGPRGTGRELAVFPLFDQAVLYVDTYSPRMALLGRWD
jgi:hypothetical protein